MLQCSPPGLTWSHRNPNLEITQSTPFTHYQMRVCYTRSLVAARMPCTVFTEIEIKNDFLGVKNPADAQPSGLRFLIFQQLQKFLRQHL